MKTSEPLKGSLTMSKAEYNLFGNIFSEFGVAGAKSTVRKIAKCQHSRFISDSRIFFAIFHYFSRFADIAKNRCDTASRYRGIKEDTITMLYKEENLKKV